MCYLLKIIQKNYDNNFGIFQVGSTVRFPIIIFCYLHYLGAYLNPFYEWLVKYVDTFICDIEIYFFLKMYISL